MRYLYLQVKTANYLDSVLCYIEFEQYNRGLLYLYSLLFNVGGTLPSLLKSNKNLKTIEIWRLRLLTRSVLFRILIYL